MNILIVEDDAVCLKQFTECATECGLTPFCAVTPNKAEEIFYAHPGEIPIVICDWMFTESPPDNQGIDLVHKLKSNALGEIYIVMATVKGSDEEYRLAMGRGADNFINKPFPSAKLCADLMQAIEVIRSRSEANKMMIANTSTMRELRKKAILFAQSISSKDTVLITGETGTGKEYFARLIHDYSPRAHNAYLIVNCSAIPEILAESELFGHCKGAYTMANCDRKGRFQQANGGTLFLDEIGDLTLSTQAKILRAVEGGEVQKLGEDVSVNVDTRVISATNRSLLEMIDKQTFRQDLYARLAVFELHLPPLSERKEDILPIANHYLSLIGSERGRELSFDKDAENWLLEQSWPYNVRSIQRLVKRCVYLASEDVISADDLKRFETAPPRGPTTSDRGIASIPEVTEMLLRNEQYELMEEQRAYEKQCMMTALRVAKGNQSTARESLKMTTSEWRTRFKEYKLEETGFD